MQITLVHKPFQDDECSFLSFVYEGLIKGRERYSLTIIDGSLGWSNKAKDEGEWLSWNVPSLFLYFFVVWGHPKNYSNMEADISGTNWKRRFPFWKSSFFPISINHEINMSMEESPLPWKFFIGDSLRIASMRFYVNFPKTTGHSAWPGGKPSITQGDAGSCAGVTTEGRQDVTSFGKSPKKTLQGNDHIYPTSFGKFEKIIDSKVTLFLGYVSSLVFEWTFVSYLSGWLVLSTEVQVGDRGCSDCS